MLVSSGTETAVVTDHVKVGAVPKVTPVLTAVFKELLVSIDR